MYRLHALYGGDNQWQPIIETESMDVLRRTYVDFADPSALGLLIEIIHDDHRSEILDGEQHEAFLGLA